MPRARTHPLLDHVLVNTQGSAQLARLMEWTVGLGTHVKRPVDRELVARAIEGSGEAFAALVSQHYDGIYRMAWRWLGLREAAEDVAQDVCLRLAVAVRTFRGDAEFTTWLYRVTFNVASDHIRADRRAHVSERADVVVLFQPQQSRSPETQVFNGELWDEVRRLPPQQRDAVLLVYGEDLSHAEAGAIMGCSEKTVSWHLHSARKRLKDRLEAVG